MARAVEIIPALMPQNPSEISSAAARVSPYAETLQLDLMDGQYVENRTWPYGDSSETLDPAMINPRVKLELDLMVADPGKIIGRMNGLPVRRVIVHAGSVGDQSTLIKLLKLIKAQHVEPAVAVTLADDWQSVIDAAAEHVDLVQVMGIPTIGLQGMPFDHRTVDIVRYVSLEYPKLHVSVDGGMNNVTAPNAVRGGATKIVAGSYLLPGDPLPDDEQKTRFEILKEVTRKAAL